MEFVVDLPAPDDTLKLSGRELKEAIGTQPHTHPIVEVVGLPEALDEKLDKVGGTITGELAIEGELHVQGDFGVLGDAQMKSLKVDEYLEVPELKYNRITATGNEFWVTDAGVIDGVEASAEGIYTVTLKSTHGEATINFQYKDILRGVFHSPSGFRTAYFEVTGVMSQSIFTCVALNDIPPERFMTLARQGNKSDPKRQGSLYLDGLNKWLRVLDGVRDENVAQSNVKVQLGDLSGVNHPVFGQLSGYGALLENAYICGQLVQRNHDTGEEWAVGAVSVQGEQVFRYKDGVAERTTIELVATESGFTSTPEERAWSYKNGEDWVAIEGANSLSYTLRHDDAVWQGRGSLTQRYSAKQTYHDAITVTKIHDGGDAYAVQILSSSGNNFINGDIATTLEARVFKGSEDITATIPPNAFSWVRISANGSSGAGSDEAWNSAHLGVGPSVSIDGNDVERRAIFECVVNY